MPRKRRYRRRKNRKGFVAIPFTGAMALGTLANDTVLTETLLGSVFGEDIYCLSVDINLNLHNHTATEGPIHVGVAHGDLTVGEIAEALSTELTDPDDIIAKEMARRPVRRVGSFTGIANDEGMNNGTMVRTKLKFSVGDGHTLNLYAVNQSNAALTTGGLIEFNGTLYGRWQR